jgi:UDP-N-acetylglucosamine--N-acetylmuramyl-(pentapeptide) pyrophosphoryl-undecaprenol N-acetylglucosamine transferase
MKILMTGAHFTPAQAVIEELKKQGNVEIVYIGRKHTQEQDSSLSVESQVLPKLGVKFIPIIAGRLRRSFDFYTLVSLFKIPVGFLQSFFILLKERPDVILSFGGYVAVPTVINGWLLSIPIIVHEQTLVSGLANQISNFFADKIAVSFKKDYAFDEEKVVVTGNPIRKELLEVEKNSDSKVSSFFKKSSAQKLPLIYITGGNQGSDSINREIAEILEGLTQKAFVIHQTGQSKFQHFEKLSEKKKGLKYPERYLVQKWFDANDVALIFQNTDLVISRAGVNTLLELAYFGVPTVVIPLPGLYKNEQVVNAKFFESIGLCQIIYQSELSGKKLLYEVSRILKSREKFKKEAENAKEIVIPGAAKRLAQLVLILGEKSYATSK